MIKRENHVTDLGDWQSEEPLILQPVPSNHDWLQEFADEREEAEPAPIAPAQPRPQSLFVIQPVREPVGQRPAAWPARRRRTSRARIPIGVLAAGVVLVALLEMPSVHRPQILVRWSDVAPAAPAPVLSTTSAPAAEQVLKPRTEQARQEPRPEPPPRMQPQSPRRDVGVPVVAASSVARVPTPSPPPPTAVSAPPPSPAMTPAVLSVRSATSLEGLLGRTMTPATLSASPAAAAPPPATTGGPAAEEARRVARLAGVESVIQEYRRAFNTLNAGAVQAFWPGVDVRSLQRAFGQLELQRFEFDRCRIDLAGPRAFASCDGTARSVRKVGDRNPPAQAREWTFTLGQSNDAWVILNVNSRPMQ